MKKQQQSFDLVNKTHQETDKRVKWKKRERERERERGGGGQYSNRIFELFLTASFVTY